MSNGLGNVYVFNGTPNTLSLILNNMPISGTLAAISSSSGYAPSSTSVSRNSASGNPGNNTFGGKNDLVVYFPGGTAQNYPVNISVSQAQIGQDLQLYIFYNQVMLVLPGGNAENPNGMGVLIEGTPISIEEIDIVEVET
jgi:hypothetical protein